MASDLALEKHWVNKQRIYHIQNQPENRRGSVAGTDSTTQSLLCVGLPLALFHTHRNVFSC